MVLPRSRSQLADDVRTGDRTFFGLILAFFSAFLMWAVAVPVGVEIRALTAHIEPAGRVYAVAPEASGRVVEVPLALGARVTAGDPILVLDAEHEREELETARGALAALEQRRALLLLESEAELSRLDLEVTSAVFDEAVAARQAQGDAVHRSYAARSLEQSEKLLEIGLVSKNERLRLEAEAERTRSTADIAALGHQKSQQKLAVARRNRQAREAGFAGSVGALDGQIRQARSTLVHLEDELRRRVVRAPAAGILGDLASLGPGSVVAAGDKIAKIVPEGPGELVVARVESRYLPRLRPGLTASVREIESHRGGLGRQVTGAVIAVGVPGEDEDTTVVELRLSQPLAVGSPVRVEIEVERKALLFSLLESLHF